MSLAAKNTCRVLETIEVYGEIIAQRRLAKESNIIV